jgi:hypothetical protein
MTKTLFLLIILVSCPSTLVAQNQQAAATPGIEARSISDGDSEAGSKVVGLTG